MIHHFLCQCKEFTPLKWSCVKSSFSGVDSPEIQFHVFVSFPFGLDLTLQLPWGERVRCENRASGPPDWSRKALPSGVPCHLECPGEQDLVCVPGRPGHLSVSSGKKEEEEVVRKANFWVRIFHWNLGLLAYLWQVISLCLWTPVVSVIKWSSLLQQWLCGSTETVALLLNCRGLRSIHWYSLERVSNFS